MIITDWIAMQRRRAKMPFACFGGGIGAESALIAAAQRPGAIQGGARLGSLRRYPGEIHALSKGLELRTNAVVLFERYAPGASSTACAQGTITAPPSIESAFTAARASLARSSEKMVTLGLRPMREAISRKSRASERVILVTLRI